MRPIHMEKRPIHIAKETCPGNCFARQRTYWMNRLSLVQKRPIHMEKRPIQIAKEIVTELVRERMNCMKSKIGLFCV
jgi:hypothetical protein